MKTIQQIAELADTLETLDHKELFNLTIELLVIKTNPKTGERTRDMAIAMISLINDWIIKPQPKK